jgi:hypothetical protein
MCVSGCEDGGIQIRERVLIARSCGSVKREKCERCNTMLKAKSAS